MRRCAGGSRRGTMRPSTCWSRDIRAERIVWRGRSCATPRTRATSRRTPSSASGRPPIASGATPVSRRGSIGSWSTAAWTTSAAAAGGRGSWRATTTPPRTPERRWGDYRAELRARLDARRSVGARLRAWWARPAPIALSLGLLTALLLFTLQPVERRPEFASLDDAMLGARLGLLEHYRAVERLHLFDELDAIRQLDHLPSREG